MAANDEQERDNQNGDGQTPSGRVGASAGAAEGSARAEASRPHAIVGIGASAGGLEAFVALLSHVDAGNGATYVLVQHLAPTHESMLPEILNRSGNIPVIQAADGMRLKADCAYVIPAGATMSVIDGTLHVVHAERARGVPTVIDDFFKSLAEVHATEAVGVVLSGSGADGAVGIEAIKEHGGITLAQEPTSAQFASMPQSAIATGCIDFVLRPEEIGQQLTLIARHMADDHEQSKLSSTADADIQRILLMLRSRTGTDFRSYRRATVHRRILRRMLAHRVTTHAEYLEHLRSNPEDLDILYEDLLIGVTRFFRDPDVFSALRDSAFPDLMVNRPSDSPLRVWVPGCSTGEEAYSLAISLLEFREEAGIPDIEIQVFATDLSEAAIARARKGLYPRSIEADVSAERLARHFTREVGGYRVNRPVRDVCVFAVQNVVRDPPFSQLDVISCRNVLIYFEPSLQKRLIPMFNYALRPNGVLVLGAAESVGQSSEYFVPLAKRQRIFRPQAAPKAQVSDRIADVFPLSRDQVPGERIVPNTAADILRHDADRALLERMGMPGVVVNDRLEITQFRGDTAHVLQHAAGNASLHLFKLIRPELLPHVRGVIETARTSRDVARVNRIALPDDPPRMLNLEVIPFRSGQTRDRYFVITFAQVDETDARPSAARPATRSGRRARGKQPDTEFVPGLRSLREELAETKRYLQDVIDQYEGANEELRAANEELQSSLEELQSKGEELETTKEEVQSTNEELTTVNDELRHRNLELAAASADLANVFASTKIPIIIVDGNLAVRRFTPAAAHVVKIIPTDVGRPIADLRLRVILTDLEARLVRTIATLTIDQVDVRDDEGHWWSLTIRPYLTVDRKVDGAVLAFSDIDVIKRFSQEAEHTSEERRLALVEKEAARLAAHDANVAKTSFLTHLSHDLRTPLTAISGYADLLDLLVHGPLTAGQQQDVTRIKRSASYLLGLITDILNFAKFEAGTTQLNVTPVSIESAVSTLEAVVEPLLQVKGLRFEHGDCEAYVLADAERLQEILQNLTTNAIKFTSAGTITMRCRSTEATVAIAVHDTGVGIPPDQVDRIFEPFVQVDRSFTNMANGGVGLGLAISRTLARAMGGDITVQSDLGAGSTFELTLPRAPDRGSAARSA